MPQIKATTKSTSTIVNILQDATFKKTYLGRDFNAMNLEQLSEDEFTFHMFNTEAITKTFDISLKEDIVSFQRNGDNYVITNSLGAIGGTFNPANDITPVLEQFCYRATFPTLQSTATAFCLGGNFIDDITTNQIIEALRSYNENRTLPAPTGTVTTVAENYINVKYVSINKSFNSKIQ